MVVPAHRAVVVRRSGGRWVIYCLEKWRAGDVGLWRDLLHIAVSHSISLVILVLLLVLDPLDIMIPSPSTFYHCIAPLLPTLHWGRWVGCVIEAPQPWNL